MRTKHIITLIIVIAVVALVAILLAMVFSVSHVYVYCYDQEGNNIVISDQYDIESSILEQYQGSSIMSLSKDDVCSWVNSNFTSMHALAVVKEFPNTIVVHLVERQAVYTITSGANTYQLDSFGYVVESSEVEYTLLDITDAFDTPPTTTEVGSMLAFDKDSDNSRLELILDTVDTIWQLQYNYSDIAWLVDSIKFNSDNSVMTITTQKLAYIVVYAPTVDLSDRLIDAFSVYANYTYNLQIEGAVITVLENGSIITTEE